MKTAAARKRKKPRPAKQVSHPLRRAKPFAHGSVSWIRELAAPYLKGYSPVAADEHGLRGFWFIADSPAVSKRSSASPASGTTMNREQTAGFFVGYLLDGADEYSFLKPEPPECIIFAWVSPAGSMLHERLVKQPGSLVRKVFEYIRWLTHRPPRFVFHEAEAAAMARHASMAAWSPEKRQHLSRNFFIETLAWLVRSGLVRKLREEASTKHVQASNGKPK
ncbi:MAG TPA: hypothetical protein VKB26_00295 [Candidatus Acidoferrales bacterium]|nr:hypothetical protein [Candidatus Acidoferrales bacterium]